MYVTYIYSIQIHEQQLATIEERGAINLKEQGEDTWEGLEEGEERG